MDSFMAFINKKMDKNFDDVQKKLENSDIQANIILD